MLIRWARKNCFGVHFVLEVDDDMLLILRANERSLWGYLYGGFLYVPMRNVKSKRYVSRQEYALDTYPDFLSGTAYLISGDVISTLEELKHGPGFFPLEDIYLTAMLAQKAKVSRLDLESFSIKHVPYNQPCLTPRVVTPHEWTPAVLRRAWMLAVSRMDFQMCLGINTSQMAS
ncbi:hypothetical protein HPB52_001017 [Rhipicephalus sanguineus]|uniref:Hexosyltransferase n=1 Tax=Rhipicephalus sanguineus TaxID=34632 RepID=A0A9D4SM09_RHISA|nr:hypothetical protein HPB52_001017 [Rhipicephalus sanguineus]